MNDGIRIVDDIFAEPGVDTLEGRIGPLVAAARGACHFIHLPAGGCATTGLMVAAFIGLLGRERRSRRGLAR
ncbi:MAG: hypothetical protein ACRD2W_24720 [Acidimicrobiales bacterium]